MGSKLHGLLSVTRTNSGVQAALDVSVTQTNGGVEAALDDASHTEWMLSVAHSNYGIQASMDLVSDTG